MKYTGSRYVNEIVVFNTNNERILHIMEDDHCTNIYIEEDKEYGEYTIGYTYWNVYHEETIMKHAISKIEVIG